jgi:PAS domain S-box-containing protein
MKYKFSDLVDIERLQSLMDDFYDVTKTPLAILDIDGKILTATGWQDICTKFHRVHPETSQKCSESDTALANRLAQGKKYNVYKCLNGLVDVAAPILVDGKHLANLFTGQFFFEPPDTDFFKKQAAEYNFDEASYLEAMSRVPVFSEDEVKKIMAYLSGLTEIIGEMGLIRKRAIETVEQRDTLLLRLNRVRAIIDNTSDFVAMSDLEGKISYINSAGLEMVGRTGADPESLAIPDFHPPEIAEQIVKKHLPVIMEKGVILWESKLSHADGTIIPVSQVIMVIRNEDGEPESIGTIMRDITDIRQKEKALRVSEEKYRTLVAELREEIEERKRAEKEIQRLNEELEDQIKGREGKYLIFTLGGEEYGISILKIRELIGIMPIIPIPGTPNFVKGVINLRGRVIPITDLRLKFGIEAADCTERTSIIVIEIEKQLKNPEAKNPKEDTSLLMGIIVDSVSEVVHIRGRDIKDSPLPDYNIGTNYILGVAPIKDDIKILMDIENILSDEEVRILKRAR